MVGGFEGPGVLVHLVITHDDGADHVSWMARTIWGLRLLRATSAT